MKKFLLLLLFVASVAISVQAKPEINVGGVEVESSNYNYISGKDIKSGYAKYDESTNTLTLYNIKIERTGTSNYGIHNRKCDNLTIVFSGSATITTEGSAMNLQRSTTINVGSGTVNVTAEKSYALELASYSYYIKGSGNINFKSWTNNGTDAIHGNGISSTTVYFRGAKVSAYSPKGYALNSFKANFESGADLTIQPNNSKASVNNVSMSFYTAGGKIPAVLQPFKGQYYNNSICINTTPVTSDYIYISDQYVAVLNEDYFKDWWLINELHDKYYPKGYITSDDIAARKSFTFTYSNISTIRGLGYFTELTELNLNNLDLTGGIGGNKGLSSLTKLQKLYCKNTKLSSLDISGNPQLQYLDASNCKITSAFTLSYDSRMIEINLSNNQIPSFTATSCPYLKKVDISYNNLTLNTAVIRYCDQLNSVNVAENYKLTAFSCTGNKALTSLDASTCRGMNELYCSNNNLSTLKVNPTALFTLECQNNQLTSLDVNNTSMSVLEHLNCSGNKLTTLTLNNCRYLEELRCDNNQLTSIVFPAMVIESLKTLSCQNNQLTSLDKLPTPIESINCQYNKFTTLSITGKKSLKELYCQNNASLTTLTCTDNALVRLYADNCPALTTVNCRNNQLVNGSSSGISLSNSTNVTSLTCSNNKFTGLYVSNLTNLTFLDCQGCQLTSLDVSSNKKLATLYARDNALTSVNLDGCSALSFVWLQHNNLSALSLQGCNKLHDLFITRNKIKGSYMTSLINSLRSIPSTESTGVFGVIAKNSGSPEYNEITAQQVQMARAKRWIPKEGIDEGGSTTWVDIPSTIRGDINGDNKVDVEDVNALINIILEMKQATDYPGIADLNGDNKYDVEDVNALINIILTQ